MGVVYVQVVILFIRVWFIIICGGVVLVRGVDGVDFVRESVEWAALTYCT